MRIQTHSISVPVILEVRNDALRNISFYIKRAGIEKIVVFLGEGIKSLFGDIINEGLHKDNGVEVLNEYEFDDNRLDSISKMAFGLPPQTQAIVGIGGGKALDVAKYVSFLNDKPFISIPTSTAHDGFASSGCSLYINNRRTSVHAKMPYGIIVDIDIIRSSPDKFIFSGIGDIVSKITAVFDWQFEEQQGKAFVDDFAVMIAKKSVNSIVRMQFPGIKEEFFLKELIDSLTMSGIAMEIAGDSSPASGSEHLISHALDKLTETPLLHGIQVGIATYIMSIVQQHRNKRISKFLTETGFFDYVKTLDLKAETFEKAIDLSPSIKPSRKTFIHFEEHRSTAKSLLYTDPILKDIFKT